VTTRASSETASARARVHAALSDPSRLRLLEVLEEARTPLDARELAERVGLHVNTVRTHLRLLTDAVLVSVRRERGAHAGRPRLLYEAQAEGGGADELRGYRLLAEILAGCLASSAEDAAERAERAGEAWGRYLIERPAPLRSFSEAEAITELLRVQRELGFQPELAACAEAEDIVMHRCPFLELAKAYQDIVCAVHRGLIQGVLAELRGSIVVAELQPFVRPGVCVAHLAKAGV
jgi:predicted ArsR family transcriptional regulator